MEKRVGSEVAPRPGGRTARVTEQILDAVVSLIAENGVGGVSHDAVAKLAGASRATVYRKWPQRDDLLRAALVRFAEISVSAPDTGNIREDLVDMLCSIGDVLATASGRAIINMSLLAGDADPIRQLGRDVLASRIAALQARIDGAVETGQLPSLDVPFLNTMLVAPVYLHVMRERCPLARDLAERVVDAVLDGMAAGRS